MGNLSDMESGGQKGAEERLKSRDRQAFTSRGDLKDNQQGPQVPGKTESASRPEEQL